MSAEEKNVQPTHLAAALQLWICISAAPAALPLPNSSQRSSLLGKFSQDSCFLFSSFCLEFSLGDLGLLCSHMVKYPATSLGHLCHQRLTVKLDTVLGQSSSSAPPAEALHRNSIILGQCQENSPEI